MPNKVEFVSKALKKCLTKKNLEKLSCAEGSPLFGWEKWLQIELANQLKQGTGKVWIEERNSFDGKNKQTEKRVNNSNGFLDIVFRQSNELRDLVNAVEIKLNKTEKGLKAVLKDLLKIKAFRHAQWDYRSVTCVLVHGNGARRESKFAKLKQELLQLSATSANSWPAGDYDVLVFGWEENLRDNMNKTTFNHWLKEIERVFRDFGVVPLTATKIA